MNFKSTKKRSTLEKMVIGVFVVVGLLFTLQIGAMVWLGAEVVGSVQESGGVKEALKVLAKDTKEVIDAYKGE